MYINIKKFAFMCGILWGAGVFAYTWYVILSQGATGEKTVIGRVYRGYGITPKGSVIGFVWGFFDGLLGGAVLGWLYNAVAAKFIH